MATADAVRFYTASGEVGVVTLKADGTLDYPPRLATLVRNQMSLGGTVDAFFQRYGNPGWSNGTLSSERLHDPDDLIRKAAGR